ncbi:MULTISPECIES: S41 family peptidase [Thermaerobacter]|uniref:S41 family peptidase n=1 Tax=Thermaerobacter composti TaxID=554949 RepID=A0ABZ0QP23_9FIRM|nr:MULTISPECIES: S41 family peptidase [Thermaerobacter]PZN08629.1 MAG: S41 family peptidase [Bacillota bacterium]QBS37237.1 S41 family peptidase [Thermaerobacter sp. FW80]WPD19257.1 S41 family peptidase [Thermaerobacter composti]
MTTFGPSFPSGPAGREGDRPVLTLRQAVAGALVLILLTAVATLAVADRVEGLWLRLFPRSVALSDAEKQQLLDELVRSPEFDRFLRVIQLVRTQYVDPLPLDQLLEGAARGVVAATGDPFSAYFDPEEFREFRMDVSGHYTGIGVTVSQAEDGGVVVQSLFEGSPGATTPFEGAKPGDPVGLRPGDVIVAVDGKDVTGESVEAVARMIRGPEGTQVTVEVMRRGHDRPLRFVLTRRQIDVPSVQAHMLEGGIGYIHLTQFLPDTPRDFEAALEELRSQGMRGLILDLRNNPGGELQAVVQVADRLLPRGPIVHIEYRNRGRETHSSDAQALGLPLVVLINQGSASASEILAGAIQDYGVGVLVGEHTFGKGTVQTVWPLEGRSWRSLGGEAAGAGVKLTVARYLTPKERPIVMGKGIEPDVKVPFELEDLSAMGDLGRDPQLQAGYERVRQMVAGRT